MSNAVINIPGIHFLESGNFLLIAGPCVVESEKIVLETAEHLVKLSEKYQIPFVFKSSYRKANRSRGDSFTGIGDIKALKILEEVRMRFSVPVITDIHNPDEAAIAAGYVDILQIPAFLCRQTDLLSAGNNNIMLTDRGNMFGYQDIVVDFRNIPEMQKIGVPVIMDITHSLQQPNQEKGVSGGRPEMIETLGKAAISVGADGIFIETHPDPSVAKSDGANMLKLSWMENLLNKLTALRKTINSFNYIITNS